MRLVKAVTALLLAVCVLAAAAPARAEVAVIEVARVIDASAPGKAGQKYVDNLALVNKNWTLDFSNPVQ